MKLAATLIVTFVTVIAAAQTAKPDDPCRKANSQGELNQCTQKKFHAADDELQKLFRSISARLDDNLAKAANDERARRYAAAAVSDLKAAQDAWVTYRDLQCKAEGGQEAGGSIQSTVFASCMESITSARIQQLHATYDEK